MTARVFLGFDFGGKLIGVAVGSTHTRMAQPVATVRVSANKTPDWDHIERIVKEWRPHGFVVGLPLQMDGTDQPMTRAARKFGEQLRARYNAPVHMVDERLTTRIAKDVLYAAGIAGTRHKRSLDKVAAQTILQAFLETYKEDSPQPGHDDAHGN